MRDIIIIGVLVVYIIGSHLYVYYNYKRTCPEQKECPPPYDFKLPRTAPGVRAYECTPPPIEEVAT